MLAEVSVIEQRLLAVRDVLDNGAKVIDVATRYGVDRRTVHRWLVRYANGGISALSDKSAKPDTCPHQMPPQVEARIIAVREAHPSFGPRTILTKLRKELEHPTVPFGHIQVLGPAAAHRPEASSPTSFRLQALGALASDGAVADRCHGRCPPDRRDGDRRRSEAAA